MRQASACQAAASIWFKIWEVVYVSGHSDRHCLQLFDPKKFRFSKRIPNFQAKIPITFKNCPSSPKYYHFYHLQATPTFWANFYLFLEDRSLHHFPTYFLCKISYSRPNIPRPVRDHHPKIWRVASPQSPGLTSMLSRVESSSDLQFVVSQSGEVPLQINTIEQ